MQSQKRRREALEREAIDVMIHTMRLHHRVVEKRVEGQGVHHSQHRMLMKLSRMGKSASQKDIAEALDVSPACVARTLKHLSAAGLIDKAEGADGRRNEISILPRGQRMVDESLELFRQIGTQMFRDISEEELAKVNGVLRRVQNNLIEMEGRTPLDGERREGSV